MKPLSVLLFLFLLSKSCQEGEDIIVPVCDSVLLQEIYKDNYFPWHKEHLPYCELFSCSEWLFFIHKYYREFYQLPHGTLVGSEDVYDWLYDEGAERIYSEIFIPLCAL